MIGETISHYRILKKIGEGGMGEVYAAEDTDLERRIALKVLPASIRADPDMLDRFRKEAKAIAALDHPNIVTIHSVEESDGVCFFTMELLEGNTLGEWIPSSGLPLEEFFELAIPLVDAVRAAHERGVTHRDLKPGNIMVTRDGRVKVLDFGLAKTVAPSAMIDAPHAPTEFLTEPGIIAGTVPYMSPEQLQGKPLDSRSDIFSLGIILFEMATSRRPFRAGSPAETVSSILRDVPDAVRDLRSELAPQLGRIIDRCLEKDPKGRFQTAHDLGCALEDLRDETAKGSRPGTAMSSRSVARTAGRQMIVVLPFENLGEPEDRYLADGISEEITSRLAAISGLGVISRTSAFQYETKGKTVKEIGRGLGVDFLLEGTVRWDRQDGGLIRVRITPQLIRVADDIHLWSDRYDRVLEDVFAVQTEIAKEVIERLGATILESEKEGLQAKPTENMVAYQAYVRGREWLNRADLAAEQYKQAVLMLEQAVGLDSSFALAYVDLAEAHLCLYFYGFDRSDARLREAKEAVDRALALQPDLPAAHLVLGYYHYRGHLDYDRALKEFSVASQGLPNDPTLLANVAYIWRRQGLMEQAQVNLEQAAELSPQDFQLLCQLGMTYTDMRRFSEAIERFERSISVQPDQQPAYLYEAAAHWGAGNAAAARSTLERVPDRQTPSLVWFWYMQEMIERNYQEAVARLSEHPRKIIELQYWFHPKDLLAGIAYRHMDELERARRHFERALPLMERAAAEHPDDPRVRSSYGRTLAELGRKEAAIREAKEASEICPVSRDAIMGPNWIVELARSYVAIGESEAALDQIEYVLSIPCWLSVPFLKLDPDWDPLRGHPRYERIIASS
ncbi:MAG: protein kinase [Candidatus Eisenbacteria sp.]|nr:protein kinase [Candidatus Eisenbacteria bacterium]